MDFTPARPGELEDDIDFNPNPRAKTRVGEAPGEKVYEKVIDPISGRKISKKPANAPFFAHQKWKAEQAAIAERRAKGIPEPVIPREPWTLWRAFKTLVLALMLASVVSNFVTGGPAWGYEAQIRKFFKRNVWKPNPRTLTLAQLGTYSGANPNRPIYISIEGQVYDVSASRRIYGPGGSYNVMAGVDASRSFITGCFQPHHITHDLRGISADDLKALDAWKKFFADHAKYEYIGTVSLPPIDPSSPIPGPCVEYDGAQAAAPGAVHGEAAPVPGAGAAREASHNKKSERLKRPNADREL